MSLKGVAFVWRLVNVHERHMTEESPLQEIVVLTGHYHKEQRQVHVFLRTIAGRVQACTGLVAIATGVKWRRIDWDLQSKVQSGRRCNTTERELSFE